MSVCHFGFGDKNCAKKTGTDNVTSSKSSVFRRPHEYATVSLKKSPLWRGFSKSCVFIVYVWTVLSRVRVSENGNNDASLGASKVGNGGKKKSTLFKSMFIKAFAVTTADVTTNH